MPLGAMPQSRAESVPSAIATIRLTMPLKTRPWNGSIASQ